HTRCEDPSADRRGSSGLRDPISYGRRTSKNPNSQRRRIRLESTRGNSTRQDTSSDLQIGKVTPPKTLRPSRNRFGRFWDPKRALATSPVAIGEAEALSGGINLFNEERFWESHEVLESIWRVSEGSDKEALHSLILIAAAFVHFQKGEPDICLSVLKRATTRMPMGSSRIPVDFTKLRQNVDSILNSGRIQLFKI